MIYILQICSIFQQLIWVIDCLVNVVSGDEVWGS